MWNELANTWWQISHRKIRDQKGLWVTSFLRQLAFALISVFSVVFVFSFGRERFLMGGVQGGLLLLILYLFIARLTVLVSVIPIGNLVIRRIGYRRSVVLSLVLSSLAFSFLAMASAMQSIEWLLLAPVAFGWGICLYWVTYNTLFAEDSVKPSMGSSFGLLETATRFGQVAAPIIGASVAVMFGFEVLFMVGILFLLASGVPMLFLKHHLHTDAVSWKEFFNWEREGTFKQAGLAMGGRLIQFIMMEDFWPVYVFLLVGSLEKLGIFKSVLILATGVFTLLVAKIFDKSHSKKIQAAMVSGSMVMWVARAFVTSLGQILLVDSVDKFFAAGSRTFFFGFVFRRAKGRQLFSFVVYWHLWEAFWALAALAILALVLVTIGVEGFWYGMLFLGALGSMLTLLVKDHK